MTYIVLEMQTNDGTTALVPPAIYTTRQEAESKYHLILTAAAVSQIEEHAATILTGDGRLVRNECYHHPKTVTPVEVEEGEN